MNQKDYKAIAKIIKNNLLEIIANKYDTRGMGIINDLADYFEKEDTNEGCGTTKYEGHYKCRKANLCPECEFNRDQFLKDCGVEE